MMWFAKIQAGLYEVWDGNQEQGIVQMVNETLWLARSKDGETETTGRTRQEAGKRLIRALEEAEK